MADIHVKTPLDRQDRISVRLYRGGIALAALVLWLQSLVHWWPNAWLQAWLLPCLLLSGLLIAQFLHLYDKRLRILIQLFAWLALWLMVLPFTVKLPLISLLAQGLVYAVICGIAIKEYLCFRLTLIQLIPLTLVLTWAAGLLVMSTIQAWLMLVSALLVGMLTWHKWRMPLHYDIGDKRKYQV